MENLKEKLTYRQEGDYLIPNIAVSKDESNNNHIVKYGYLRLDYLKKNKKGYYIELMLDGKLPEHLIEIDKQANKKVKAIIRSLAKLQNVDEKLKANNQIEWVKLMNNLKNSAEEIVLNELIYN
jgi:tnpV protein